MSTVPVSIAKEVIMKMDSERQELPLLILEQFDPLFSANGYVGYYQWSNLGGAQYFIYKGKGKLNNQYRIEIEMFWDEINFTIYRSLTWWEKFTDFLKVIAALIICMAWILILVDTLNGYGEGTSGYTSGSSYSSTRKKRKSQRSFKVKENVAEIVPGFYLNNAITPATYDSIISQHKAFFEQYLMPTITGQEWMGWRRR